MVCGWSEDVVVVDVNCFDTAAEEEVVVGFGGTDGRSMVLVFAACEDVEAACEDVEAACEDVEVRE